MLMLAFLVFCTSRMTVLAKIAVEVILAAHDGLLFPHHRTSHNQRAPAPAGKETRSGRSNDKTPITADRSRSFSGMLMI